MWPSLSVTNQIAGWANVFLIISLVVGVVSTVAIVWTTGVKEAYWDQDRLDSTEHITALTAQSDQLRKDTAEANARAAEAQLALEQFKAPRRLLSELQKRLTEEVVPLIPKDRLPSVGALPATVYNLQLATQIASALGIGSLNQGAAETNVGPARGVVAAYVTLNERGKAFAEALAKVLNEGGITAAAVPGLMERLFHPVPGNDGFKPMDPTEPGQSWVVIVVGDKP
jgi:hypothetical protein